MHELTVARSLVEAATQEAHRHGARAIRHLRCRIGALRQVDDWLLQEAFDVARQGTPCEGSRLIIEKTFLNALCRNCNVRFTVTDGRWHCPACGTEGEDLCGGEELELTSIDVDMDEKTEKTSDEAEAACNTGVTP